MLKNKKTLRIKADDSVHVGILYKSFVLKFCFPKYKNCLNIMEKFNYLNENSSIYDKLTSEADKIRRRNLETDLELKKKALI